MLELVSGAKQAHEAAWEHGDERKLVVKYTESREKREKAEQQERDRMLITRAQFDEGHAQGSEVTTKTPILLKQLDELLDENDELLEQVRVDLAQRYRLTTLHGRPSTPVEVILRLFVLKQLFNWGLAQTAKQVRASALLCWFCRLTAAQVPHASTLLRWVQLIRPETCQKIIELVLGVYTPSRKKSKSAPRKMTQKA